MKSTPLPALSEVAHKVSELIADHAPRFVAVIPQFAGPVYGHGKTSFGAMVNAIGHESANLLCAEMHRDGGSYFFDEVFGRDAARLYNERGELLALIVRG
jgi:hypothetical protein